MTFASFHSLTIVDKSVSFRSMLWFYQKTMSQRGRLVNKTVRDMNLEENICGHIYSDIRTYIQPESA